jgi:hypothetical protein
MRITSPPASFSNLGVSPLGMGGVWAYSSPPPDALVAELRSQWLALSIGAILPDNALSLS